MGRTPRTFVAVAALGLNSCSLEAFGVRACFDGPGLAFELGSYSGGYFGLRRVRPQPNQIWIGDLATPVEPGGYASKWQVWNDFDYFGHRPRISRLHYGEPIAGTKVGVPPAKLQPNHKYRITIADGGHTGMADFVLNRNLPLCGTLPPPQAL